MIKMEIINTGQIMEIEPELAIELIFNGEARIIDLDNTGKTVTDQQGHKVINMICADNIAVADN